MLTAADTSMNLTRGCSLMFILGSMFSLVLVIAKESGNPSKKPARGHPNKKSDEKRVYGGKEIQPPPSNFTVTEEIWFDLKVSNFYEDGQPYKGRVTIGCFGDITPVTCLNFISLAKGYRKGRGLLTYKGTKVERVIRDFMIQMGEVQLKTAKGQSIFGNNFQDENFVLSHSHGGWVGMANSGPNTNGSQFYVVLRSARWLDGKNVVFGKVLKGMDVLETIAAQETNEKNEPYNMIIISDCGVAGLRKHYTLTQEQLNTDKDVL